MKDLEHQKKSIVGLMSMMVCLGKTTAAEKALQGKGDGQRLRDMGQGRENAAPELLMKNEKEMRERL